MIKLYNVQEDYIDYLRETDQNVLMNKNAHRPYVGVVLEVNTVKYYIPLMSPKPKHSNMRNSKDFHKIAEGKYGAINFNKMVPVCETELTEIDIDNESDPNYRSLLRNQFKELLNIKDIILRKSQNIHNLFLSDNKDLSPNDIKIKERCCNFPLLEEKMHEYINRTG